MLLDLSILNKVSYDAKCAEEEMFCTSLTNAVEDLINIPELTDASLEGISSFTKTISSRLIGISKSFAAKLTRTSRSEIRFYNDEHSTLVKAVEAKPASDLLSIKVDIPTGMTGKYLDASQSVLSAINILDIDTLLKDVSAVMDSIISSISKGSDGHEKALTDHLKLVTKKNKEIELFRKKVIKHFKPNAKGLEKKVFKTVFNSPIELKGVRLALTESNDNITMNNSRVMKLKQIEKTVDLLISRIDDSEKEDSPTDYMPSEKFMNSLAKYLGIVAYIQDTYSDLVIKQMAIEHNLVMVYQTLIKEI